MNNSTFKKIICPSPFSQIFVYPDGNIYLCSSEQLNMKQPIGNINNNTFEKIWKGNKTFEKRIKIKSYNYQNCFLPYCFDKSNFHYVILKNLIPKIKIKTDDYPRIVNFSIDYDCNANCIFCRQKQYITKACELKEIERKIEEIYLPMLKNANEVTFSKTSEPFYSVPSKLLMSKISSEYKNIKFNIVSNGILFNKENCDKLAITDKLSNIMISVNAATDETYKKIVPNGNFKELEKNLLWLKNMKQNNKIQTFYLSFIITTINYKEMPLFVDFAKQYGAECIFKNCYTIDDGINMCSPDFDVTNKFNEKYEDFINTLKNDIFDSENCHLSPNLGYIRKYVNA